jgi:hypothetical protein
MILQNAIGNAYTMNFTLPEYLNQAVAVPLTQS